MANGSVRKLDSDYISAARRKAEIAEYHLEHLFRLLNQSPQPDSKGRPPVPVQAHFEGILISVIGAEEKVKEAIKIVYETNTEEESSAAYRRVGSAIPRLAEWHLNPLGKDVRCVRNLALHHHYEKRLSTDYWEVQPVGSGYPGSRELRKYCKAAVRYVEELIDMIPEIEAVLRR